MPDSKSPLSTISENRPRFSPEEAGELARTLYGVTGALHALPSERDQNFRVTAGNGEVFVLKISGAGERRGILDLQHAALEHLAAHFEEAAWPRICRTGDGASITRVDGHGGRRHLVRMLTFVDGRPLCDARPHSPGLLNHLGAFLGRLNRAFADFTHEEKQSELIWNMDNGPDVVRRYAGLMPDAGRRDLVLGFCEAYEQAVGPWLDTLPRQFIHNDANDQNVLVRLGAAGRRGRLGRLDHAGRMGAAGRLGQPEDLAPSELVVAGLIDFGDMVHSCALFEPAVAAAYVMLGKSEPLSAAAHVVAGYHAEHPLSDLELELLYHCAVMRLCMSVAISAHQQVAEPENTYLSVSEQNAWDLLEKLEGTSPSFAEYLFRDACGRTPCPQTPGIEAYLSSKRGAFAPVMGPGVDLSTALVFDLSVSSPDRALLGGYIGVDDLSREVFRRMEEAGAEAGIGRYDEARQVYSAGQFALDSDEMPERRTIHLGMDVFLPAGSPVFAPMAGTVHSFRNNTQPLDYGPCIILEHAAEEPVGTEEPERTEVPEHTEEPERTAGSAPTFYTLYGHLSVESLNGLFAGKRIEEGERFATLGDPSVNGGWPPHLHFQVVSDMLGKQGDFPGVGGPSQRNVWRSLSPDPNAILGVPAGAFPPDQRTPREVLSSRREHIGRSLSVSYRRPLKIVRGYMQYLYDDEGRAFLDAVNNVPHVGHSHPRVVAASHRQMAVLNTNTRYLHDNLVDYAERLCAKLPDPLSVCFFVNSGSEANDLALRLARAYSGQRDLFILDGAYHGNLTSLVDISPYKFDGPGGEGAPPHVHKVPLPDPYRGPYKGYSPETGARYAEHVRERIYSLAEQDRGVSAFITESLPGCGGQIVLPDGYFKAAFQHVRESGGVCIADEVQVGFGRVGSHFWGFETQDAVPDIVTLGKPIGNGHPLGAVVTTPEIAGTFDNGMEYFNTFGGNPVSCAIGLAVLDIIEEEGLQANALEVGGYLLEGLRSLAADRPIIGDVRGMGLYVGVELVLDRDTLEPGGHQASYVANRMRDHGVLISTDGPLHNVLKIKPPLVFTRENADYLLHCLGKVLEEDYLRYPG